MRSLAKPEVLKAACLAGAMSAVVCYPRIELAKDLPYPTWYLESGLFLGSIVLWGFVFAWYGQYAGRPLFTMRIGPRLFVVATACGLCGAALWYFLLDPVVRPQDPKDYPATLYEWIATTLFALVFTELFVVFSPFAWLVRLFRRTEPASVMTVLFGLAVMIVREHASKPHFSTAMFAGLLVTRLAALALSVFFFLRGGVLLVWWWVLLLRLRELWELS